MGGRDAVSGVVFREERDTVTATVCGRGVSKNLFCKRNVDKDKEL